MNIQNDINKTMQAFPSTKVAGMVRSINAALDRRIAFEESKAKPAYIELREADKQIRNNALFARFLLACNASPDVMLNNVRKDGYRSNLKAVRKLRMLAEYCGGKHGAINAVCKSLFAATIIAANKGATWISNKETIDVLSNIRLHELPEEIAESIVAFNQRYIESAAEAENQACQFRTAFENLGCYFRSREDNDDFSRNGIRANLKHPLIAYLNDKWKLKAA